jgi:fatty acid desaturase
MSDPVEMLLVFLALAGCYAGAAALIVYFGALVLLGPMAILRALIEGDA